MLCLWRWIKGALAAGGEGPRGQGAEGCVGVFITVTCRSKFLMTAKVWSFSVCKMVCMYAGRCAVTEEQRST